MTKPIPSPGLTPNDIAPTSTRERTSGSSKPAGRSSRKAATEPVPAGRAGAGRSSDRSGSRGRAAEKSDVLVSAVISTYLLTHLHHVLQRAEYAAAQDGRQSLASNYAQLRKVLCLDARTMEDASASGQDELEPPCAA